MIDFVYSRLNESARVKKAFAESGSDAVEALARLTVTALNNGGKLLFCGNGGSAADAQHLTAEFVVRLRSAFDRNPLPAISLTTNSSLLTACANDYDFSAIFSRQVRALGRPGDILVGISTSGNSANIIAAFEEARSRDLKCVLFSGETGGKLKDLADLSILVPSRNTMHIQETHIAIGHIFAELVEEMIFNFLEI